MTECPTEQKESSGASDGMNRMISRLSSMLAVLWLMVTTGGLSMVHGLELGDLTVDSHVGEPLKLILELETVSDLEAETLEVSLAGRAAHQEAGIDYPSVAGDLKFTLNPVGSGEFRVVVSTEEEIKETNLRLLVSAIWSGGSAFRDYAVELGLPVSRDDSLPAISTVAVPASSRPPVPPGGEMTVRWGDTLSHIVQRMGLSEDIHRFQGYLAVLRANPDAFIGGNMNRLRSDVTLQLPTLEEIAAVSYQESVVAYSDQLARFTAYKESLLKRRLDALESDPEPESNQSVTEEEDPAEEEMQTEMGEEPLIDQSSVPEVVQEPEPEQEPEQDPEPEQDTSESPSGGQLTISQEAEVDSEQPEDEQSLLANLERQLDQMEETLAAGEAESESTLGTLQTLKVQAENISTLIEVEDAALAEMQNRAQEGQEIESGGEDSTEPEGVSALSSEELTGRNEPAKVESAGEQSEAGDDMGEEKQVVSDSDQPVSSENLSGDAIPGGSGAAGASVAGSVVVTGSSQDDESGSMESEPVVASEKPVDDSTAKGPNQSDGNAEMVAEDGLSTQQPPVGAVGSAEKDEPVTAGTDSGPSDDRMKAVPEKDISESAVTGSEDAGGIASGTAKDEAESSGISIGEPQDSDTAADTGEVLLAQQDGENSMTYGTVSSSGGGESDNPALGTIRNATSSLMDHAGKIVIGLLILLAVLFLRYRRRTSGNSEDGASAS